MGTSKNAKEKGFCWTVKNENSRKPEEPVAISVGLEVPSSTVNWTKMV